MVVGHGCGCSRHVVDACGGVMVVARVMVAGITSLMPVVGLWLWLWLWSWWWSQWVINMGGRVVVGHVVDAGGGVAGRRGRCADGGGWLVNVGGGAVVVTS